jgi:hypothetical protein
MTIRGIVRRAHRTMNRQVCADTLDQPHRLLELL